MKYGYILTKISQNNAKYCVSVCIRYDIIDILAYGHVHVFIQAY